MGLWEKKVVRDPSGSRLGRKIGIKMASKQPYTGLGEENCLRDPIQ